MKESISFYNASGQLLGIRIAGGINDVVRYDTEQVTDAALVKDLMFALGGLRYLATPTASSLADQQAGHFTGTKYRALHVNLRDELTGTQLNTFTVTDTSTTPLYVSDISLIAGKENYPWVDKRYDFNDPNPRYSAQETGLHYRGGENF